VKHSRRRYERDQDERDFLQRSCRRHDGAFRVAYRRRRQNKSPHRDPIQPERSGGDVLSAQNAFDVATFIDSQPRTHQLGNERDFPDGALKPADATYPFLGPVPPSQHLTGPWQPIREWQKDNARSLRRKSAASGD
jgi:hypothetical protein